MVRTFKEFAGDGRLRVEPSQAGSPDVSPLLKAAGLGPLVNGAAASSGAAWTPPSGP